jgi:hypothetical protein
MKKTFAASHSVVERLEKKYQKKIRFQKYKSFTKQMRQQLSRAQGSPVDDMGDEAFDIMNIRGYEYIS